MAMNQGSAWGVLTRQDLRDFDNYSTKAVLTAMERGGVGRRSSNGHVILRAPNGETMSVTRNSTKSKQVTEQRLRRLFPEPSNGNGNGRHKEPTFDPALAAQAAERRAQWFDCPAKGCDLRFPTEGARYQHIDKHHVRCTEEGCNAVAVNERGRATHHRLAHQGWKPREGTGKAHHHQEEQEPDVPDSPTEATSDAVTPSAPKAGPTTQPGSHEAPQGDGATLQAIRLLLGDDPRVKELQQEVARLKRELDVVRKRAEDAAARLALLREALEA